jgi:hypothetical protein
VSTKENRQTAPPRTPENPQKGLTLTFTKQALRAAGKTIECVRPAMGSKARFCVSKPVPKVG